MTRQHLGVKSRHTPYSHAAALPISFKRMYEMEAASNGATMTPHVNQGLRMCAYCLPTLLNVLHAKSHDVVGAAILLSDMGRTIACSIG